MWFSVIFDLEKIVAIGICVCEYVLSDYVFHMEWSMIGTVLPLMIERYISVVSASNYKNCDKSKEQQQQYQEPVTR